VGRVLLLVNFVNENRAAADNGVPAAGSQPAIDAEIEDYPMKAKSIIPFTLALALTVPGAALAQGPARGLTGGTKLGSGAPSTAVASAGRPATAFQFANPGLVVPGSSFIGANTPAERAIGGLNFNSQLRNGVETVLPDPAPMP
jgi:hypothetical protein